MSRRILVDGQTFRGFAAIAELAQGIDARLFNDGVGGLTQAEWEDVVRAIARFRNAVREGRRTPVTAMGITIGSAS